MSTAARRTIRSFGLAFALTLALLLGLNPAGASERSHAQLGRVPRCFAASETVGSGDGSLTVSDVGRDELDIVSGCGPSLPR